MKIFIWLLKAAIFFLLFAFALNNPHEVRLHFLFGAYWQAPMVLVLLLTFGVGLVIGALGMVPRWWRQRRAAQRAAAHAAPAASGAGAAAAEVKDSAAPPYGI